MEKHANCEVEVPDHIRMGTFANSFRLQRDGEDLFFDFVKYSPGEHKAEVVARVRLSQKSVKLVMERLLKFWTKERKL